MSTACLLHVYCMSTACQLHVYCMSTACSHLPCVYFMSTARLLHVYYMYTACLLHALVSCGQQTMMDDYCSRVHFTQSEMTMYSCHSIPFSLGCGGSSDSSHVLA